MSKLKQKIEIVSAFCIMLLASFVLRQAFLNDGLWYGFPAAMVLFWMLLVLVDRSRYSQVWNAPIFTSRQPQKIEVTDDDLRFALEDICDSPEEAKFRFEKRFFGGLVMHVAEAHACNRCEIEQPSKKGWLREFADDWTSGRPSW
jgi:hypothetical protein